MKLKSLLMTGLVAVSASVVVSGVAQRSMSGRVAATTAPSFELRDARERPISLVNSLRGRKAVLLNFWFAACPPCREEMPHLQNFYARYKSRGLEVVGINATDDSSVIAQFGREFGLSFPLARDAERQVSGDYKVVATPTNILIDEKGSIIWRSDGFDPEGLKKVLDEVLPPANT